MPDPNTCIHRHGEKPGTKGYEDCLAYEGKYKYKSGGTLIKDDKIKNPNFTGKNRRSAVDYSAGGKYYKGGRLSQGGMLVGPSHENGGIQAIVDGTEPIEVEGGEFVINKQTVDAVGETFLHKLNSTSTSHHTGGYESGELPTPSNFKDGGKINGRNKMARGGRVSKPISRRMARGGRFNNATPSGRTRPVRKMGSGGYRRGGRTKPKLFERGGVTRRLPSGGSTSPNSQCRSFGGDAYTCKNTPGCTWNPDGPSCH